MFSSKELCQSLACFVIGGIIAVIFIKTLEWQRSQNHEERQRGERRMIVPTQEVGDRARERQEERIVHGCTVNIPKIPREQDDL